MTYISLLGSNTTGDGGLLGGPQNNAAIRDNLLDVAKDNETIYLSKVAMTRRIQ